MNSFLRPLLLTSLLVSTVLQAAEREQTFAWSVGQTPIVKLNTFYGSITVEKSSSEQVELVLKAEATGEQAERWLENIAVQGSFFGGGLAITVKNRSSGVEIVVGPEPMHALALTVRVPAACNLDLASQSGSIAVADDLQGRMRARTEVGDIFFGRVEGSVDADTAVGDVVIARATGSMKARSRQGNLNIGTALGRTELRTSSGDIDVLTARAGLDAESSSGDVAIGFGREVPENVRVKTSAGDVKISLDPAAALQVQARAVWGKVNSQVAFAQTTRGGNGKSRLEGVVNGGGPLMALWASGGNVRINAVPTYDELTF